MDIELTFASDTWTMYGGLDGPTEICQLRWMEYSVQVSWVGLWL